MYFIFIELIKVKMRINNITFNNFNSAVYPCKNQKSVVNFSGTWFEEDSDFIKDSIFDLRDRKQREFDIGDVSFYADYWAKQQLTGYPVTDPDLKNLKINSFRALGNNNYKGGMLTARDYIAELKNKGIKKFIILCYDSECDIVSRLKEHGMDYHFMHTPLKADLPETVKDEIMEKVFPKRYIESMFDLREGNVFIGCESGNWRTRRALSVLKRLDPKSPLPNELASVNNHGNIKLAKWIYQELYEAQKAALGYTPEFENALKILFDMNKLFR